jgi:hypothetical protein
MPAVITMGGTEFQHDFRRVWAELDSGGVVRVVNISTGRLKAWVTPECPPGFTAGQVVTKSPRQAVHSIGELLDAAALGGCTEVKSGRGSFYVHRVMPQALAPVEEILPGVVTRTSHGRTLERQVVA